ncbi:MAG: isochorismatase family protein [Gemmatimonadota bacterium]|nr:MAG: isochorismatase family protein [Gemmatimonadota bacterium]
MDRQELLKLIPEATWRQALPSPDHTALLVVDMQEYFRSMVTDIIPDLDNLISVCRDSNIPVIYTQHGHEDPSQDGGMLGEWWGDLIIKGTRGAHILREIEPQPAEKIIAKNRYSAFYDTDLEHHLKTVGVKDLLVSGVMTNLCCETTARDAFVRDFRVFFLADGTATAGDDYHLATLRNLAFGFAYILTCDEIIDHLKKSRSLSDR